MKVYVAIVQENDYETEPFNIGVYSSKEKAEEKILDYLNWKVCDDETNKWFSLRAYDYEYRYNQDNKPYLYSIEYWELDQ